MFTCFKRHNPKSGPETWDPGPWDLRHGILRSGTLRPRILGPRLWDPGPWDLGPRDFGTGTLDLGTCDPGTWILTPGTLVMGPWDPVTSSWPTPRIVLTLFVKQILRGHGMCVEKVGAGIQKKNLGIFSSHFYVKSKLTLQPIHIFAAFVTYSGKVVA